MPTSAIWFPRRISTARSSEEPHVAFGKLEGLSEGLIALTAGAEGALARLIADGQQRQGRRLSRPASGAVSRTASTSRSSAAAMPIEDAAEAALIDLAYARDLPLVATNPAAYADPSFHAAHDAMLCIANSAYVESTDRVTSSPDAWLKDGAAMAELFADLPEALANTAVIAQRCAVAAPKRKPILPRLATTRTNSSAATPMPASQSGLQAARRSRTRHAIASGSTSSSTSSPAWVSPATS